MSINAVKKIRVDRTLNNSNLNEFSPRSIFDVSYGSAGYNPGTGVFSIPYYTSQLNNDYGFIRVSDLSPGVGINIDSYGNISNTYPYVDTSIIRSALSGGSGIVYNSETGVISATASLGSNFSGSYTDLTNKPALVAVATSGSYTDLINKPTLAAVATSGNYADLTNKPTIPTNTNQLTNGNSFITLTSLVAGTGITYNNTTGVIGTSITQYTDALARAAISAGSGISYNSTTGVISATGGFSGSYTDLTDKPTIPTNTSQLTNGSSFITLSSLSAGTGIAYNNTTGVISSSVTQYTDALARAALSFAAGSGGYNSSTGVITIPTNTSHLTNGAGFITASDIAGKQATLVSGTNIKTINGTSLLGSGDIAISGGSGGGTTLPTQAGNSGKYLTTDGSNLSWSSLASTNNFDFGYFIKKFSDPISYILDTVGMDFGTFTQAENLRVDLGTF